MLIAIIVYATYIPLMVIFVSWSTSIVNALRIVVSEIMMFITPFVLLTNLCGIQRRLAHKPAAAIAAAIIISLISFFIGACIFLYNI